jgi:neutral ceramidase
MSKQNLKAGVAKVNVTPVLGTVMNGDFVNHYAQRIHSHLFAKALVLSNTEKVMAFVVVDICMMDKEFVDQVKSQITDGLGILRENIIISSTHTHGSPSIAGLLLASLDLVYRNKLAKKILEAVKIAKENTKGAKFAYGSVQAPEHLLCRRYLMQDDYISINPVTGLADKVKTNPGGAEDKIIKSIAPIDPELSFIAIKSIDDEWISLLANYSLHYVGDWADGTITSDYFGEFAKALQTELNAGDDFLGIMTNGTSGDVNIWDFKNPERYPKEFHRKSELIGNELAIKIVAVVHDLVWDTSPLLSGICKDITVKTRKPKKEELPYYEEIVERSKFETIITLDDDTRKQIYAREQLLLSEYTDEIAFPIQVLKIGDCTIGALGGEFFSETGLNLKKTNSAKPYFTITIANGYVGYVPPKHEIEKGGYETWRCRTSFLAEDAEEIISNELKALIN